MSGYNGLISTAELAGILDRPGLRLFDCTTYLEPAPADSNDPYIAVPGRHSFEAGHIPGADFLDLQGEFSDPDTQLRFMMPDVARLEAAFGRHGISDDSEVVLYSIGTPMWATRFWWMLTSLGFDNVAVLDGGLDKWKAEGRPTETGAAKGYPPATFTAKPKQGFFVDKRETLAATSGARHRGGQCARPAVPQGARAQPLWPAGPRSRQLQRIGGHAARSADQGLHPARGSRGEIHGAGHHQGQARGGLLRRRHLGHHRPVPAAPARLRQPHPLRRLDGRMGQGHRHCRSRRVRLLHRAVIPGRCEASNPESRDSGSGAGAPSRNDGGSVTPARSDPASPSDPAC